MLGWIKAQWYRFVTNGAFHSENMTIAQWRRRHSRVLVRQILSSLKLQPVALAAEVAGACVTAMFLWDAVNPILLVFWLLLVGVHFYGSVDFNRRFWADRYRHARIHFWMRAWMVLAIVGGLIWALAGITFAYNIGNDSASQVILFSVILTVTFASWPVYACWLPSLVIFTLCAVTPLVLRLALIFGWSRLMIAALLVTVVVFMFYSGKRFNEIVQSSVRNDQENEMLVKRLTLERNLAEKLRRETQEQSRLRSHFFTAANHDIRQPLQAIGIYIQLLKKSNDPKTLAIVEQLAKTTQGLQTLVAQILEVSKLETGHTKVNPEPIKLATLLEELALEFEPIAKEKGLSFRLKNLDVNVCTDVQLLTRAIRNLLTNAIAYTEKGEVLLAARRIGGKRVSICVVDSGPGIEQAEQKKIFQTFYRSENTRSHVEGYGLGLSIVKVICDQLNIKLSLGSHPGRGSIFRLELPIHEAEQARIFSQKHSKQQPVKALNATVVLIEDNTPVRESLTALMENWGTKVIAADVFSDALAEEVRKAGKIDAVVSDFNLGEGEATGLESILRLSLISGEKIPAILLTAVSSEIIEKHYVRTLRVLGEREAALFAMPRIMQKPVTGEALNEALHELVQEHSR